MSRPRRRLCEHRQPCAPPDRACYLRSDHFGSGYSTSPEASSNGQTTLSWPPRHWVINGVPSSFCPVLASNLTPFQGMIIWSGLRSVASSAFRTASGSVEPARLIASSSTSMPVNERDVLSFRSLLILALYIALI